MVPISCWFWLIFLIGMLKLTIYGMVTVWVTPLKILVDPEVNITGHILSPHLPSFSLKRTLASSPEQKVL